MFVPLSTVMLILGCETILLCQKCFWYLWKQLYRCHPPGWPARICSRNNFQINFHALKKPSHILLKKQSERSACHGKSAHHQQARLVHIQHWSAALPLCILPWLRTTFGCDGHVWHIFPFPVPPTTPLLNVSPLHRFSLKVATLFQFTLSVAFRTQVWCYRLSVERHQLWQ